MTSPTPTAGRCIHAANRFIFVSGIRRACREPGQRGGVPLVQSPHDMGRVNISVLVVKGDSDNMVPTPKSRDVARSIPGAALAIYPDAGHGGIFQLHTAFVAKTLAFLAA